MAVRTPDPEPEPDDEGLGAFRESNPPSPDANPGWLSEFELAEARRRLPMLYVEAIPVRTDGSGQVTEIGILLRSTPMGEMTRTIVSGRVRFGETVRDALFRHVENDLGPMAFPLMPPQPLPFTVAEYFPTPGVTPFHDPRQHAVSLAFVVPVTGDCAPQQDALDLAWLTPDEALAPGVLAEMERGHGVLLRQALAHLGHPV